jgi:predicted RNA-binding protein (virulence factor B family)
VLEIGKYNELTVVKEVPFGIYLETDQGEVLMPLKYVPEGTKPGDTLNCFVYKDSEDRLIATTQKPKGIVDEFVALTVKDVSAAGAFMDWGLLKDLLVPYNEQHKKMEVGKKYVVRICLDEKTDRIIGVGKLGSFLSKDISELREGQKVNLLIYEFTDLGVMAIINNRYRGMLYKNEVFKKLEVGDRVEGYIKKLRDEDDKIDLSLQKQGYGEVEESKDVVMQKLLENGGTLPFSDNSSPEEIKDFFQISKKTFKKIIGGLYKEGKIILTDTGISLNKKG